MIQISKYLKSKYKTRFSFYFGLTLNILLEPKRLLEPEMSSDLKLILN